MNVDIFITSYRADLRWLLACLRSIKAHLTGYRNVVVVYAGILEPREAQDLTELVNKVSGDLWIVPEREPGHMNQQVLKMTADKFVRPGCDWICQIDSDCFFHRPTDISMLFPDGKRPVYHYGDWLEDTHWKKGSEEVLGFSVEHHMMRRQGMCFKPCDLKDLRVHIVEEALSCTDFLVEFDQIVLERWDHEGNWKYPERDGVQYHCPGKPTMSEFIVIGGFMWRFRHDTYDWRNTPPCAGWPSPPETDSFVRQYWSHSGVTPEIREEMSEYLRPYYESQRELS